MKRVLFTGGTGFIGKNILPSLRKEHVIFAPSRTEMNLYDIKSVDDYITQNNIEIVVHSANPNPVKNVLDSNVNMLKGSLQIFMNFYLLRNRVEKILYIGSGAEYDKRYDIQFVKEENIGKHIPIDEYGFAKFIMNELAQTSENIYNLRLFACYGPYDFHTKFITHAIRCCLRNENITIRQDCMFDYLHVDDLGKIVNFFIKNKPLFHDYNICSGTSIKLSQLAEEVRLQMQSDKDIVIEQSGLNKEYTADNTRMLQEYSKIKFINIKDGINKQIMWEREHYEKESC